MMVTFHGKDWKMSGKKDIDEILVATGGNPSAILS